MNEEVSENFGGDVVRVVEAERLQRIRGCGFKVAVLTLDALDEEGELGVHVGVESREQCLADIAAHFGVALDADARFASEKQDEVLLVKLVLEIGICTSLALLFGRIEFAGTYRLEVVR